MTTATITPKAAAKSATKAPATKAAAPTPDELATITAALRERWTLADAGETKAQDLFTAAGIAFENSRIIKVRVAYAAAMVKPNGKAANLLNACRILFADPTASAKEQTKQAEAKKSTLRNYVDAGTALDAESLAFNIGEPTEEERKIVAAAFRAGNKRDKAEAKGKGEGEGEGEGKGKGEETPDNESLTYVDLVALVARLNAVLDMLKAGNVVVSEREASAMADMLNGFQMKLSEYAEGK